MSKPSIGLTTADARSVATGFRLTCISLIACVLLSTSAFAQDRPSAIGEITKQVLTDPTTYVPSVVVYSSLQLDWNSSQPFFQNGFFEENARYTRSGRAHDVALSYGAGTRKIIGDSLAILPASMANNAFNRLLQRSLNSRFPNQRKLWTTIAWIERAAFATYSTSVVSSPHFEQWKQNQRLAKQLGY